MLFDDNKYSYFFNPDNSTLVEQ